MLLPRSSCQATITATDEMASTTAPATTWVSRLLLRNRAIQQRLDIIDSRRFNEDLVGKKPGPEPGNHACGLIKESKQG